MPVSLQHHASGGTIFKGKFRYSVQHQASGGTILKENFGVRFSITYLVEQFLKENASTPNIFPDFEILAKKKSQISRSYNLGPKEPKIPKIPKSAKNAQKVTKVSFF